MLPTVDRGDCSAEVRLGPRTVVNIRCGPENRRVDSPLDIHNVKAFERYPPLCQYFWHLQSQTSPSRP